MRNLVFIAAIVLAWLSSEPCHSADFHIFAPDGCPIPVKIRAVGFDEGIVLFRSDESDEAEANMLAYWAANPDAYYRWDVTDGAEMGLVTDIARNLYLLQSMGCDDETVRPQVVVAVVDGCERVVAVGTFAGDVHFHSDSFLRRRRFHGMGTCLVVAFLQFCRDQGRDAFITSVNSSYGFYEKMGFQYSDPAQTPMTVADPAHERYDMFVALRDIPVVLSRFAEQDAARVRHFELHGSGGR